MPATGSQVTVTSLVKWPHRIGKICVKMPLKSRQKSREYWLLPLTGLIYDLCRALRGNILLLSPLLILKHIITLLGRLTYVSALSAHTYQTLYIAPKTVLYSPKTFVIFLISQKGSGTH